MKNYLVITLGTREIQLVKSAIEPSGFEIIIEIRKETPFTYVQPIGKPDLRISARRSDDFPDFFTISPRKDGLIIKDNWTLFRPILDWPLIYPALAYLKEQGVRLDIIMLIYTDQEAAFAADRVKKKAYIDNDTVFFADIVENLIREDDYFNTADVDVFGRFDSVADMGAQYDEFRKIEDDLISNEEVGKVYLFPQGGIDQINQALTLRLIEAFEGRVIYLQNSEDQSIKELDFPARFVDVLNLKKIEKHLEDYDFGLIVSEMLTVHPNRDQIFEKADYASKRLNLQYADIALNLPETEKLKDLYLAMKIRFLKQRKYNEFLWRAHTLNENLFKVPVEAVLGPLREFYNGDLGKKDINFQWEEKLNDTHPQLLTYLKKKKISVTNPNRWAYKSIYIFMCNNGLLTDELMDIRKRVGDKLELLAKKRNDNQHNLDSIRLDEIKNILGGAKADYSEQDLFDHLNIIFNITGFGIYDTIGDEIKNLISQ